MCKVEECSCGNSARPYAMCCGSRPCDGDCTKHRGAVHRYYTYVPKLAKEAIVGYCEQAVEDARNAGFTVTRI